MPSLASRSVPRISSLRSCSRTLGCICSKSLRVMNLYKAQTVNGLSEFFTVAEFAVELVVELFNLVVELIAL